MTEEQQAEQAGGLEFLDHRQAPEVTAAATLAVKDVFREMTDEAKIAMGTRLAELEMKHATQVREKKAIQSDLLAGIRETAEEIATIAEALDSGKENIELEVFVDFDQERKEVRAYDPATKVCIERRRMTEEEETNPGFL